MQFWNGMQRKTTMVGTDRIMVGDVLSGLPQYVTYSDFVALVGSSTNVGKSAYEIYTDVTTDNPIKSESEWIESLYGQPGQTPTIGSNGNWFIGTTDTGVKAQPENPVPVQQFYNGHHNAIELYVGLAENISPDYRLCNGNNGVPVNGVVIPDLRKFFLVGYDPNDPDYNTIGKTGGAKEVTLTKAQVAPVTTKVPGITGGDNSDNNNQTRFAGGDKPNGQGTSFTIDVNSDGGGQAHENRPPYYTVAYIIRVVPQVISGTLGTTLTADQLQIINTVPLVCSDEKTDLTASIDVPVIRFVFQTAQSFTKIVGELNTAAAGGTFTVVAKKNGVSFLSTPLTFDGGENTTRTASVPFVFTTPTVSFSVGDYVEIFITAIGAVIPGKGLKIYLM